MVKSLRLIDFLLILGTFPTLAGFGLPPTLVLGAYGDSGAQSVAPSSGSPYGDLLIDGLFGWRQALGPGRYLALSASGSLSRYLITLSGFEDYEHFDAQLGLPSGENTFILGGGIASSVTNQTSTGSFAWPYWSAAYQLARGKLGYRSTFEYRGSYLYEPAPSNDHFTEGVRYTLDHLTNIRLETYAILDGSWELWNQQPILASNGSATSAFRQDYLAALTLGAKGILGYYLDWRAEASGGLRLSDADTNQYLATASQYEANSESRASGRASASLTWSPTRSFSMSVSANLGDELYLSRKAVTSAGALTSESLNVLSTGGGLRLSWTPNGKVYLVLKSALSRSFSPDPNYAQWSLDASGGVQYSF